MYKLTGLCLIVLIIMPQSVFALWRTSYYPIDTRTFPDSYSACEASSIKSFEDYPDCWISITDPVAATGSVYTMVVTDIYYTPNVYQGSGCHKHLLRQDSSASCRFLNNECPAGYQLAKNLDCILLNGPQKNAGSPCNKKTGDGNPCDAATGNKFQIEQDYHSSTLNFVRYYNSLYRIDVGLGKRWSHTYSSFLNIDANNITIQQADGKAFSFTLTNGLWKSQNDIISTLTQAGENWQFSTDDDVIETYNSDGQLINIQMRDGKTTTLAYNIDSLLESVTDPYGRALFFAYDSLRRISKITTPDNNAITYQYHKNYNLIKVIYPDSTPGDNTDNPSKSYHYGNVFFPHYLTGITDENGIRYATWAYNDAGLAILSEHANSAEKVELVYNTDETTTVTDALGRVKTYTFETHYGLRKPKTIEYNYNDGKQTVTKSKTYTYYPDNGRVKDVTDYNGNITYYEYNTRGLVTLETKAKGTPEEYNITITWHPDFRLPTTRTYPDKTVIYDYDTNGQLMTTHTTANP